MAATQQVVWTLLPQGFSTPSTVRFTVLVSPRLTFNPAVPNPTIGPAFPDWMDWPKALAGSVFHLVVNGTQGPKITPKAGPDSKVWQAMVPASTKVDNYKFTDLRSKTLLSYPVALLAQTIEGMYAQLGVASPSELPTKGQLPQLITEIGRQRLFKSNAELTRQVYDDLKNKDAKTKYYTNPMAALELLSVYHRPLNAQTTQTYTKHDASDPRETVTWKNYARKGLPSPAKLASDIDFHKIVSVALDHHDLSRWMGLVLDFEVQDAAFASGNLSLSLKVDRPGGASDVYPITEVFKKAPDIFDAVPKANPNPLAGRYLNLQAKGMDLVQLDVDGGGLKINNLAEAAPRLRNTAFDDESFQDKGDVTVATPSLRTAGLMLAQARRDLAASAAFDFNGALQDALSASPPKPLVLNAEDLIRGYRVDIQDLTGAPGQWRSLMQRTVDFTFTLNPAISRSKVPEEGMMRLSGGSSTDGSNPDVLKIHEGVFVWRGWSLAAPEPFQAVGTAPDPSTPLPYPPPHPLPDPPPTPILGPDAETPAGVPLKTRHVATPKTLPSLRFGRHYQVRVRAVDLSGESLPPTSAAQPVQAVSDTVVYRRYEPVAPPALALPSHSGAVTPVGPGESMGLVALQTLNDTWNDPTVNPGTAARVMAPPRVAVRFAEPHGVLDTPAGKLDGARYGMLKDLDNDFAVSPASGTPQHAYAEVGAALPYLPDPMAVGVAIRIAGIAGIDPAQVFKIPLYGDVFDPAVTPNWPYGKTFQIVGAEVAPPAQPWDPAKRIFTVPLAKGERAILRLSSLITTKRLEQLQLAYLIAAAAGQSQVQMLKTMMEGQHWMLTPWTTLVLVHAVQRPLRMPDLSKMGATRSQLGQLDAEIEAVTPLAAHSTGRIDLRATWNEALDDPQNANSATGPYAEGNHQHVLERTIARNETPAGTYPIRGAKHAFHDTRYRRVKYELDAASRYREFMPGAIASVPEKMIITSNPPVRRWIASTAPPPAPQVVYVIPTFGWSRSGDANQKVSLRAGGGLRVYLDRPWFATGFGEMLAVVLPGPEVTNDDLDYAMRTQVTQWGRDPVWTSAAIKTGAPARASAFPLALWNGPIGFDSSGGSVPLPASVVSAIQDEHADLPPYPFQVTGFAEPNTPAGKTIQIAPHAVGYDTDRQLWYCDIVIRPPDKAYYPFIRLALARYQPTSVEGAYLSQVVTTEFQQLSPDRLAVVSKTSSAIATVANIAVYGYAPSSPGQDTAVAGVFDAKSQVLNFGDDPDLMWRDLDGQPTPTDQSAPAPSFGQVRAQAFRGALPALPPPQARLDSNYSVPAGLQAAFDNARLGPTYSLGGLQGLLGPGLLWSTQLYLPQTPAGGRRRVLITESESYVTGETPKPVPGLYTVGPQLPRGLRIIYAEAVEI